MGSRKSPAREGVVILLDSVEMQSAYIDVEMVSMG
jgi:hypothetical protein